MFALKRLDNDVRTEVVPLPHDFVLYSVASVSNAHNCKYTYPFCAHI